MTRVQSLICCAFGLVLALTAAVPASAEETLQIGTYPGSRSWIEVTNKSAGAKFLRELIPADQKVESYKDILSAQSFPGVSFDPADFLQGFFTVVSRSCTGVRVNGPVRTTEGGYDVAYAQIYCGRQNGQSFGANMMFKAIRGDDALYVVQREFRVKPSDVGGVQTFSKEEAAEGLALMRSQAEANDYLTKTVHLCGPRSTDARCR